MGYQTNFSGSIVIEPPLTAKEVSDLNSFSYQPHDPNEFPGHYCQWIATNDGTQIEWDGGEKFYDALEWMQYIVEHFVLPGHHEANGEIFADGEETDDIWWIVVENNVVTRDEAKIVRVRSK